MAWSTPRMTWRVGDGITSTDFNRIETNTNGTRFGHDDVPIGIASAASLAISSDFHLVTGNTQIDYLGTSYLATIGGEPVWLSRSPGAKVLLQFEGANTPILSNEEGSPGEGYAEMKLFSDNIAGDITGMPPGFIIELVFDGTYWTQIGSFYTV
jgi:hypothetical protein